MNNFKHIIRAALVLPLALAIGQVACGGDGGVKAIDGDPDDIVGTWTGTWSDPLYSVNGRTIEFTITDSGGTLSGTAMVQDQGSPTPLMGTITGTLSATTANFTVDFTSTTVTLTFDGSTLTLDGSFAALSPFDIEAIQNAEGTIVSRDVVLTDGTATEGTFMITRQ